MTAWGASLWLGALGLGALLHGVGAGGTPLELGVLVLAGVAVFLERQPVRVTANVEMTATVIPLLFAAVVYGPLAAMFVGAASLILDLRRPFMRWAIWTAVRVLSAGLAAVAAGALLNREPSLENVVIACSLAAATEAIADGLLGALTVVIRNTGTVRSYFNDLRPVLIGTLPFYIPATALLVFAYKNGWTWSVLLFAAPAYAAQSFYRLYRRQALSARELLKANDQLMRANISFATALVATLDARDRYTAGHSAAVAIYARDIAEGMGLSSEQRRLAHLCGLVHDIGKIGLPPGLLEKPGGLTPAERRQMERHSEIGERILANVEDYQEVAQIVRHHHERVDGQGYPDGWDGTAIPLLSRIIAVADAYDAMTSDRPYRNAMPSEVARLRLAEGGGAHFDTEVVAAFEAILLRASDDYRYGRRSMKDFQAELHAVPA